MKKLLLPIILLLIGTGAGAGAGFFLKPEPKEEEETKVDADACLPQEGEHELAKLPEPTITADEPALTDRAFARLNNQFVVPIVEGSEIAALMALSLTVEVDEGNQETIYRAEPKLRDAFLQVMFDHANTGAFSGNFTTEANMRNLRKELLRSAHGVVGDIALDVLILDIVRQDN